MWTAIVPSRLKPVVCQMRPTREVALGQQPTKGCPLQALISSQAPVTDPLFLATRLIGPTKSALTLLRSFRADVASASAVAVNAIDNLVRSLALSWTTFRLISNRPRRFYLNVPATCVAPGKSSPRENSIATACTSPGM